MGKQSTPRSPARRIWGTDKGRVKLCMLPPHILHEIANRGTPAQRGFALDTLASDHTMRFGRAADQLMATGAHKLVTPAPAAAEPQNVHEACNQTSRTCVHRYEGPLPQACKFLR
jgi:hypothetical protein